MRRGNFPYIEANGQNSFNITEFEHIIHNHTDIIESFTWIPFVGDELSGQMYNTYISD